MLGTRLAKADRINTQPTSSLDLKLSLLARELLAYLGRHPHAADTLRGAARWWLLRHRIQRVTENVKRALDELVEVGLVVRSLRADGEAHYRLNRRRMKQVRALLTGD